MTPEEIESEELRLELKRLDRQSAILNLLFTAGMVLNSIFIYGIWHHWSDWVTVPFVWAALLIAFVILKMSREGK